MGPVLIRRGTAAAKRISISHNARWVLEFLSVCLAIGLLMGELRLWLALSPFLGTQHTPAS
jgi:hypothetical protein